MSVNLLLPVISAQVPRSVDQRLCQREAGGVVVVRLGAKREQKGLLIRREHERQLTPARDQCAGAEIGRPAPWPARVRWCRCSTPRGEARAERFADPEGA